TVAVTTDRPRTFAGFGMPGYRPVKVLGEGAMGIVYQAERLLDQTPVALKMLKIAAGVGPRQIQRFRREAQILGELRHRHIVSFHEAGAAGNQPFIVMEYVQGTDADTIVKKNGPLPIRTTVRYT